MISESPTEMIITSWVFHLAIEKQDYKQMKVLIILIFMLLAVKTLSSKEFHSCSVLEGKGGSVCQNATNPDQNSSDLITWHEKITDDSSFVHPPFSPGFLTGKPLKLYFHPADTIKLVQSTSRLYRQNLNELVIKNNFGKKVMSYILTSQGNSIEDAGVQSITYFKMFEGKKIASIRIVSLHPFGSSIHDTTLVATRWMEKAGNRLHMNTVEIKLRMQLQFHEGENVIPELMAENEKLMRDKNYIEDVTIQLVPVENNPDEVNVIVISKDKFEYGINAGVSTENSNLEIVNENMFGLGHRLSFGMAQKNAYLPNVGVYSSYQIDNPFGTFINAKVGFSNTYIKNDWYFAVEKRFLTSKEENVGGVSYDHVYEYNFISEDHPIELDTTVAYVNSDLWFAHAFSSSKNLLNKTILSFRYYQQIFDRQPDDSFGESEFLRNHNFFLSGVGFSNRNLYKNNLVYGYGITEDIPYGHYYEIKAGLDKSQFGVWPYLGFSLSNAFIGNEGSYYFGQVALDGFFDTGTVKQGTMLIRGNFFSKKFFAYGDPVRAFVNIELLGGINRLDEEYITIDNHYAIRDFHTNDLKGKSRLKVNLEAVRYLKFNFYGFKFTTYLYTDFAFLSEKMKTIFKQDFYAGIGAGLRIYNESLIFKIIDIRLSWFPILPPEGMNHFATNFQGITKSTFEDFLGKKPEVIRYQ